MAEKTCCPVLALVLERDTQTSAHARRGFSFEYMFQISTGKPKGSQLVYHFPKAKRGSEAAKGEHASATYALVKVCPFCGKKVKRG